MRAPPPFEEWAINQECFLIERANLYGHPFRLLRGLSGALSGFDNLFRQMFSNLRSGDLIRAEMDERRPSDDRRVTVQGVIMQTFEMEPFRRNWRGFRFQAFHWNASSGERYDTSWTLRIEEIDFSEEELFPPILGKTLRFNRARNEVP
jgi:hypothetical protein